MSVVKKLYEETKALIDLVEHCPAGDDERDQFLVELDRRLADREKTMMTMKQYTLSPAEKKLGREIVKLNKQLTRRMEQLRVSFRANITRLQAKKTTAQKYENRYDSDGVFFDQRGV